MSLETPVKDDPGPLPGDWQLEDSVNRRPGLEPDVFDRSRQSKGRNAAQQGLEYHVELDPGQRLPNALMDSITESEMITSLAVDVERRRVRIMGIIAVRREVQRNDALAGRDHLATDFDVLFGNSADNQVNDRQVPQ